MRPVPIKFKFKHWWSRFIPSRRRDRARVNQMFAEWWEANQDADPRKILMAAAIIGQSKVEGK